MTSEDPIPLDQDPMQSWIGVAHSGGLCTLDNNYALWSHSINNNKGDGTVGFQPKRGPAGQLKRELYALLAEWYT